MKGDQNDRKQARPRRRAACVAAHMGRPVRQLVDREQAVPLTGRAVAGGRSLDRNVVTLLVSHSPMGWLKAAADENAARG